MTPRWGRSGRISASGANAAGDGDVRPSAPAGDVVGHAPSADHGLVRAYTKRTQRSAASFAAAGRVLPGGETRAVTSYPPLA